MPVATIEIRRRYSIDEETALIKAVHDAMEDALKIPVTDRIVRLIVHEPHRFAVDPGKDDRFTLVTIDLFEGRSLKAKSNLYAALVRNLEALGIPANHVKTLLHDLPRENFGVRGVPCSEIDLGFEINV
jgi:phenylpyruvate tautomerase PptA (4-oxalocrotonate tautomerase family)